MKPRTLLAALAFGLTSILPAAGQEVMYPTDGFWYRLKSEPPGAMIEFYDGIIGFTNFEKFLKPGDIAAIRLLLDGYSPASTQSATRSSRRSASMGWDRR